MTNSDREVPSHVPTRTPTRPNVVPLAGEPWWWPEDDDDGESPEVTW